MNGGVIIVTKGSGDVYFLSRQGKEVIEPSKDIIVKINEEFPGLSLNDAVEEAKRFIMGAIKKKVAQKMRGFNCYAVVKDIHVSYKIKFGFVGEQKLERELHFNAGDQIVKKGDVGKDFFWIKEGIVEIDDVEYHPGCVFGRAAFGDGVRKKDVYAKTDAVIIAIKRDHPELVNKIPVLLEKFAEEVKRIKEIRPKAKIDKVDLD